MVLCVPDDIQWIATVRGAISALTRGRFWARDDRESSIIESQATARIIEDSIMTCNLTDSLDGIRDAINQLNLSSQVSICCDSLTPPVEPTEPVFDPHEDPLPPHLPQDIDDALCLLLNYAYGAFKKLMADTANISVGATLLALLVVAIGFVFPEPVTTALGGATLVSLATLLFNAGDVAEAMNAVLLDVDVWIKSNSNEIFCRIKAVQRTSDGYVLAIWGEIRDYLNDVHYGLYSGFFVKVVDTIFINSFMARKVAEQWLLDTMQADWLPPDGEGLDCSCTEAIADCGEPYDFSWSWTWPDDAQPIIPNGDFGEKWQEDGATRGYDYIEEAYILKPGSGGEPATRLGAMDIPANYKLVCIQVLARSTDGYGLKAAQQSSSAVSGSVTPVNSADYEWYIISPVAAATGEDFWINSDMPTTTASISIRIKEVRWLLEAM